jgi:hypothetical protein
MAQTYAIARAAKEARGERDGWPNGRFGVSP